jgi:hypothetical protein
MEEQLQHQRFERKYFITERQALEIRALAKTFLVPDQFSEGKPDYSYAVHSIYLDSADLMTYWATVHCEKKRFKLRVRFYDDHPESPLFFEIKRRENECVLKQRAVVRRSSGASLLGGHFPGPGDLVKNNPKHLAALQRFCYLMQRLNAQLTVHVAYMREAWVSRQNNSIRLTVDRTVRGERRNRPLFITKMENPIYPFGEKWVLELKFTDRFPEWFAELVRHFDLLQCGVPKYCGSVAESGDARAARTDLDFMQEKLAQVIRYC